MYIDCETKLNVKELWSVDFIIQYISRHGFLSKKDKTICFRVLFSTLSVLSSENLFAGSSVAHKEKKMVGLTRLMYRSMKIKLVTFCN